MRKSNILLILLLACLSVITNAEEKFPIKQGIYTVYQPKALTILDLNAELTTLAEGFKWAEGPLWIKQGQYLLFSDIPNNKVFKYSPESGLSEYLSTSNYSNGLVLNENKLVLMQSRTRQVGVMQSSLNKPRNRFKKLATNYQGKKLNSPNDGVLHNNGSLFFTDPPYGLAKQMDDPEKELSFQGVYRLSSDGELLLIDDSLTFPNGIALSPLQNVLYVAVSDHKQPAWYQYQLDSNANVVAKSIFYIPLIKDGEQGVPDGLKVHSSGVVFATGPSGVWLIDSDGILLAHIKMAGFSANLAFDEKESTLYLTAESELKSLNLK